MKIPSFFVPGLNKWGRFGVGEKENELMKCIARNVLCKSKKVQRLGEMDKLFGFLCFY